MERAHEALVVVDDAPAWRRGLVFGVAVAVFFAAQRANGALEPVLAPLAAQLPEGPRVFAAHAFVYSLVTALLCGGVWAALVRFGVLRAPRWRPAVVDVVWGAGIGAVVVAATAALWAVVGPGFQVNVDGWKMFGNVFSNFYEEVAYRGLVFGAALYAFRQPVGAALVAGAVFGFTHTQYPLAFQVFTALVGAAFAWGYQRTGSLWAAWVAHQVSDMALDTFLKG